jgi:cyclic lactone autoinducer peptide
MKLKNKINKEQIVVGLSKKLVEISIKIATIDANTACPYITYQPQKPDKVKQLRKF